MDAETAEQLSRLQVAMWLPARCAVCGVEYADVDEIEAAAAFTEMVQLGQEIGDN